MASRNGKTGTAVRVRVALWSAMAALALPLAGCALLRGHHPDAKKGAASPLSEVKLPAPKGDSVGTVDLGLKGLDSSKAPSAYASDLYLQSLDNFLTVSPQDDRAPEVLA